MTTTAGVIAAGHPNTAQAAAQVMEAGGNSFDGAIAALCAACVAEPVLASLGGGGFLLAKTAAGEPILYDFFAQTPCRKRRQSQTELHPILVDFGDAEQEFHIGMGSIATPGVIAGLFAVHRELCRMPLRDLTAPAASYARGGIVLNDFQHRIARMVEPILRTSIESFAPHASPTEPGELARAGEIVHQPQIAEALTQLVAEGPELFYEGDWGHRLVQDCKERGGHLSPQDLADYQVLKRQPLAASYRGRRLFTNPAPALGGPLILFALKLLEQLELSPGGHAGAEHLHALATAMRLTQRLRREGQDEIGASTGQLAGQLRRIMQREAVFRRGTTQISIADAQGNLASLTLSNGEGAGYVLPGTGIVLNNMLGEEDINPDGFHKWPRNRRISSMMSPTMLEMADGAWIVTGSSGSNRIRSAILQVISNLVDFRLPLAEAVAAPRIHYEGDLLNLEPPIAEATLARLEELWPKIKLWNATNVFFGGAHSISFSPGGRLEGAGDPRRGGAVRLPQG